MIAGAVIFDALKSPSYFPGTCLTSCRRPSLARPCGAFFYGAGAWPTCPSGEGSWSPSPGSWPPTPSSRNSCQEKPEWRSVPFQLVFVARRSKTHLRVIRVISRQRAKKRHFAFARAATFYTRGLEFDPKNSSNASLALKQFWSRQEMLLVVFRSAGENSSLSNAGLVSVRFRCSVPTAAP